MTRTVTLGVDPAKKKFTACLLDDEGRVLAPSEDFGSDRAGYDALLERLRPHRGASTRMVVGIEATGSLDDNLLALFRSPGARQDGPVTPIRVDAGQVARFGQARPVRGKTDSADARRIAEFTRMYADRLDAFESDAETLARARLVNERMGLVRGVTALKNRLHDRLVISFPEFDQVFADPCCELALAVLRAAPTAAHCAHKYARPLARTRVRKGAHALGERRARHLIEVARTSVASATEDFDAETIVHLIERIELERARIARIDERLKALQTEQMAHAEADGNRAEESALSIAGQIALADTLPGIAAVGAATVVLRSRGIDRFVSAKAFAAQLGVCPDRFQTGSSADRGRLTHRGDRLTRATFYLLTQAACMYDAAMAFHKWRMREKGLTPKQAVCACMNRQARILWSVIRHRRPYDASKAAATARRQHPDLWKTFVNKVMPHSKTLSKKAKDIALAA